MIEMSNAERAAVVEAMRRANPDIDGDLMKKLQELSPSAAEKMRRVLGEALHVAERVAGGGK